MFGHQLKQALICTPGPCVYQREKNTKIYFQRWTHVVFRMWWCGVFCFQTPVTEQNCILCALQNIQPVSDISCLPLFFFTEKNHQEFAMEHPCLFHILAFVYAAEQRYNTHTGFRNLNVLLCLFLRLLSREFSFFVSHCFSAPVLHIAYTKP